MKNARRNPCAHLGRVIRLLALAALLGPGTALAGGASGVGPADDFEIAADFSSPLPLVVLDYGNADGTGLDDGTPDLRIIANPDGLSRPGDPPAWEARTRLELEAGPEQAAKGTGHLALRGDADSERALPLLDLPASPRWSLIGSDRDKMMLRGYLARLLGKDLRPESTPGARYCEVLLKREGKLTYQGLYLLSEYVEAGLFLAPEALRSREYVARALERENRETPEPPATSGARSYEAVYTAPGVDRDAVGGELSRLTAQLASNDRREFFTALDSLDRSAFIDAYLICRLMMNYPEPGGPFYFHKNKGGPLAAGPLWDFSQALDNTEQPVDETERKKLFDEIDPWFSRLLHDADFITALQDRFFTLERERLSPEKLASWVDVTEDSLGPALDRDWHRWREIYEADDLQPLLTDDGDLRQRRTWTPEQEILKLKYLLRSEVNLLKKDLDALRWKTILFPKGQRTAQSFILVLIFLGGFFTLIWYARRGM